MPFALLPSGLQVQRPNLSGSQQHYSHATLLTEQPNFACVRSADAAHVAKPRPPAAITGGPLWEDVDAAPQLQSGESGSHVLERAWPELTSILYTLLTCLVCGPPPSPPTNTTSTLTLTHTCAHASKMQRSLCIVQLTRCQSC